MIKFDVITIFPEMIDSYCNESILGRARKNKKIKVTAHNLRDFSDDARKTVDDIPYGGGAGMILKPEPIYKALKKLRALKNTKKNSRTILLSAGGSPFTEEKALELSNYKRLVFVCGRYEGVDGRVAEHMVDEELSVGPYVLTGGELPALIIIDAVSRLVPNVLGNKESLTEESHSGILKEYPQFTRPSDFVPKRGVHLTVPDVLLSGDHKKIAEWRKENEAKGTNLDT